MFPFDEITLTIDRTRSKICDINCYVKQAIVVNTGTAALHASIVALGSIRMMKYYCRVLRLWQRRKQWLWQVPNQFLPTLIHKLYTCTIRYRKSVDRKNQSHFASRPVWFAAEIRTLREIASKNSLIVIEDAAQTDGAPYEGKPAGFLADFACWGLYAAKNIGTGEGGIVTTENDGLAETVRMIRTHGEKTKYNSLILGTNYRMTEIQAAIGVVQLKRLPEFVAKRDQNAQRLKKSNETKLAEEMHQRGMGAEVYYPKPVHNIPYYKENFGSFKLPLSFVTP
jgi:dTDP-4-amino-4,6-dideoxygalactose transaminase